MTATRGLPFGGNALWALIANGAYAVCQWGIIALIAKLGGPADVGQLALGLAIAAPVVMLANLQLRGLLATDAKQEFGFGDFLVLRLLSSAVALVCILVIAIGFLSSGTAIVVALVGLAKCLESVSDITFGLFQKGERMDLVARSLIAKGLLSVLIVGSVFAATQSIVASAAGLALSAALVLVAYDVPRSREQSHGAPLLPSLRLLVASGVHRRIIRMGLPLGIVTMLASLSSNVPRYFVSKWLGDEQLGIFAALGYAAFAGNTAVIALGQASSPRLAAHHARGDVKSFRRLVLANLSAVGVLGLAAIACVILVGPTLLRWLYTPSYSEYHREFVWMTLAAVLTWGMSILGYAATASRRIRQQPYILLAMLIACIVACSALVPRSGVLGACIATGLPAGIGLGAYAVIVWRARR